MYIAPVSNQNNSQVNFNGYVGSSMKKYVNSQLQRDLERLNTNDKQYGPFANTGILIDRVKKVHNQVMIKLEEFMAQLDPKSSMEYKNGSVRIQNSESGKVLNCLKKDKTMGSTCEIYDNNIDIYNPENTPTTGEITLYYIENFAEILKSKLDVNKANKALSK